VFPNEKRELSAGWRVAQKTQGRAAQKSSLAGCGKGRDGL